MGAVQTLTDARKCAELFKKNRDLIDGVIVILPNFGDEVGVSTALDMEKLKVPILLQACEYEEQKIKLKNR